MSGTPLGTLGSKRSVIPDRYGGIQRTSNSSSLTHRTFEGPAGRRSSHEGGPLASCPTSSSLEMPKYQVDLVLDEVHAT
jgi:hypothetical protein